MQRDTVLIIEDDPDIGELIQYNLEREGFKPLTAQSGEEGLKQARAVRPALVLLDLILPGIQGLDVCRSLKSHSETQQIPIIILTARGEESDVVVGLEMGADDYVTKPFSVKELVARVKAIVRRSRSKSQPGDRIEIGTLVIDSAGHEVFVSGRPVNCTLAEFRLLRTLASNPGRVLTRDQLLDTITEGAATIIDRNVDVHIRSIRKKMGDESDRIVTVRGVGYKFRDL